MLNKSPRNQNQAILSQRDLDEYFKNDTILRRNSSCALNKSDSPKSSTQSKDDRSENQISFVPFEQENEKLSRALNLQKSKNEVLAAQMASVSNELLIQQTLAKELALQKEKLIEEVHYIRKSFQQVQKQRNSLLTDVGRLRTQVNSMRAVIDTDQEKIATLEHTNRIVIDELNFERQMIADYKAQNAMFKAHLKNISNAFISLKEFFTVEREKQIANVKLTLNTKINDLREGLNKYKDEVRDIKLQQKQIVEYKNQIFTFVRRLLLNNQSVKTQLNIAKSFAFDSQDSSLLLVRESEYKRTIENQEEKIKALSLELTSLKKINMELSDQIKSNSHVQLLAPRFHTNTSYINKVIKQNHRQIMEIKDIVQMKDDEIARLKDLLDIEQSTSKAKSQQIQRLTVQANVWQNNKYNDLSTQLDQLKTQKLRLARKIDQMIQTQHSLKAEITQKDKIILNYVQKVKA